MTILNGAIQAIKAASRHCAIHDGLGSIISSYDLAGVRTGSSSFWPYGERLAATGEATAFGFCGALGYYTDSGDSTYVRTRYLSTGLGRWLKRDILWPKELAFIYAASRPTVNTDFFGLTIDYIGCSGKEQGLKDCCSAVSALPSGFPVPDKQQGPPSLKDAITRCMTSWDMGAPGGIRLDDPVGGGTTPWPYSSGDIDRFIEMIKKLCGTKKTKDPSSNVCVRCAEPNGSIPSWPANCYNPCTGLPLQNGESLPVKYLGFTWSSTVLPNVSQQNCGLAPIPDDCSGAHSSPHGGSCKCSIVLCHSAFSTVGTSPCEVMIHELAHCSGLGHLSGPRNDKIRFGGGTLDFIYKLACCICKATQPKDSCGKICDRVSVSGR